MAGSLTPRITHVMPYQANLVFIQWTVDGLSPATPSLTFRIERAAHAADTFQTIAGNLTSAFYVDDLSGDTVDPEINVLATTRQHVYRVVLYDASLPIADVPSVPMDLYGNHVLVEYKNHAVGYAPKLPDQTDTLVNPGRWAPGENLAKRVTNLRRVKIRRIYTALRVFNGDAVAILKRRHWGTRCPVCYSSVVGVTLKTHCGTCYGTTWVGGYHTPVQALAKISISPVTDQLEILGQSAQRNADVRLMPIPSVEVEDLIIELDNDRRWAIRAVDDGYLRKRRTFQDVVCTELSRSSVEYKLPLTSLQPFVLRF